MCCSGIYFFSLDYFCWCFFWPYRQPASRLVLIWCSSIHINTIIALFYYLWFSSCVIEMSEQKIMLKIKKKYEWINGVVQNRNVRFWKKKEKSCMCVYISSVWMHSFINFVGDIFSFKRENLFRTFRGIKSFWQLNVSFRVGFLSSCLLTTLLSWEWTLFLLITWQFII